MFNQKKKVNRKYQFDPIAQSALFPVVAERVRSHVKEARDKYFVQNEWKRDARRELFDSISKIEQNHISPQTPDESDARAQIINNQISIKTELKFALESLQCLIEFILSRNEHDPEVAERDLLKLRDEQQEEKSNLEVLRHLRKIMFLQRLSRESKMELESRKRNMMESTVERKRTLLEESEEESILLFPSNRKLSACGLL